MLLRTTGHVHITNASKVKITPLKSLRNYNCSYGFPNAIFCGTFMYAVSVPKNFISSAITHHIHSYVILERAAHEL